MSYPRLNDLFNMHPTGDELDGIENEFSQDLVQSIDSLATVRQEYNPYFVSDTMDLSVAPSVALVSVVD